MHGWMDDLWGIEAPNSLYMLGLCGRIVSRAGLLGYALACDRELGEITREFPNLR